MGLSVLCISGHPCPTLDMANFADLEFVGKNLPDGMKIIATTSGILEWVMWLMGYAPFRWRITFQFRITLPCWMRG